MTVQVDHLVKDVTIPELTRVRAALKRTRIVSAPAPAPITRGTPVPEPISHSRAWRPHPRTWLGVASSIGGGILLGVGAAAEQRLQDDLTAGVLARDAATELNLAGRVADLFGVGLCIWGLAQPQSVAGRLP